jgi:hypothetical protein
MRWAGHLAYMGETTGSRWVLVGKFEKKKPLGRPRRKGKIGLNWNFKKWDGVMSWIDLDQDRDRWRALVGAFVSINMGNFLTVS